MRTIIRQLPKRRDFLLGRHTIEIGYPWLTYGAIMSLEQIATLELNVLEFGGGGSTVFFSRRCKSVKTYESDREWADKIIAVLPPPSNTIVIYSNIHQTLAAIEKEPLNFYDIVLVDSGPHYSHRRAVLDVVSPLVKLGGYLVLDNYEQRHLLSYTYKGYDVYTFDDLRYGGRGTKICRKKEEV